jgi:hypothetical protein
MPSRTDVHALKRKLRGCYKTLDDAYADLSPKSVYNEGEGGQYPERGLVRRVWDYGAPGTDVLPDEGQADHNGMKALRHRLAAKLGLSFLSASGSAVVYGKPTEIANGYVFVRARGWR